MPSPSIDDLLDRWEEAQARGEKTSLEEICRDCPERLPDLRRAIRGLEQLEQMLDTDSVSTNDGPPAVPTAAFANLRYRPETFFRSGGQGEVFVARDEELNRTVALKRIQDRHRTNADIRRRFLQEAEINGRLEHPGIVPVYGLGWDATGQPFYAMRLVQGQSFQEAIRDYHAGSAHADGRALAFRKLLGHFVAVCNAVAYAHSRGVIHRDLKPANVMLGPFGETLLIDWGLAKSVGRTPESRSESGEDTLAPRRDPDQDSTWTGVRIGTPAFMSPEQAAGQIDLLGPVSDIYSLGVTLHELLLGVPPPTQGPALSLLDRRPLSGSGVADVPPALAAICRRAMSMLRTQRYPTAQALAADVERWLAGEPVSAYAEPLVARLARWARQNVFESTLALLLIINNAVFVVAVLAGLLMTRHSLASTRSGLAELWIVPLFQGAIAAVGGVVGLVLGLMRFVVRRDYRASSVARLLLRGLLLGGAIGASVLVGIFTFQQLSH